MTTLSKKISTSLALIILAISMTLSGNAYAQTVAAANPGVSEEPMSTVTLDFKEADINTVLRVMSMKSGVNIVAGPEVQGTVSIRLEDVPWRRALDVILRTYGYVYEKDGNIIRVTTRENLAQEPVVTKTFILNYSKANEIQDAIRDMLTERGRIKIAERMNMLVVTDIPTNLYTIEEVVTKLDSVTPQAYIDSKVINTDKGVTENLGFQWTPTASLSGSSRPSTFPFTTNDGSLNNVVQQFFPITGSGTKATVNPDSSRAFPLNPVESTTGSGFAYGTLNFSTFSAALQFLQSDSNTKVVSNPRVVVLNNQTASIQVGNDIPLPQFERNETTGSIEISGFSFREVGVVLNVTPHINSASEILVELLPEISNLDASSSQSYGGFTIPGFTVTKAKTEVLIQSGETIAIGGLMTDKVQSTEAKVPFLSDVPVVGKLFRSKRQEAASNSKAETLFFVTVTMVDTEGQPVIGEQERAQTNANSAGQSGSAKSDTGDASAKADKKAKSPDSNESSLEGTANA